jgi:putative membrane protein
MRLVVKNLSRTFLSAKEQADIDNAVKRAEKKTAGEIVCMLASASYHYPMADVLGGATLALPAAILLTVLVGGRLWLGTDNMWLFMGMFAVAFLVFHFIIHHTAWVKRLFISRHEIEEEVREAAVVNFFNRQLYKTRDATGVLIFISIFERKVWLLADHGINAIVAPNQWETIVAGITSGIRNKQAATAICEAVAAVGNLLADHFPIKPDDTDELSSLIIE